MITNDHQLVEIIKDSKQEFLTIAKVDFLNDRYIPLLTDNSEKKLLNNTKFAFYSEYLDWLTKSELVHPEDKKRFAEQTKKLEAGKFVIYRRKNVFSYNWVILNVMPCLDYCNCIKTCFVFTRIIDNALMIHTNHIFKAYKKLRKENIKLIKQWLKEADEKEIIRATLQSHLNITQSKIIEYKYRNKLTNYQIALRMNVSVKEIKAILYNSYELISTVVKEQY